MQSKFMYRADFPLKMADSNMRLMAIFLDVVLIKESLEFWMRIQFYTNFFLLSQITVSSSVIPAWRSLCLLVFICKSIAPSAKV